MTMSSALRKFALTAHVTTSVGWLGAVAAFLALAISGVASPDGGTMRAAYVAMNLTGWFVIVPLCLASFVSGVVLACGTPWGLLRHYWVVVKLIVSVVATIVLLAHMQPVSRMAEAAIEMPSSLATMRRMRLQIIGDAGAALAALLLATTLSVYKPKGLTRFSRKGVAPL